MNIIKLFVGKMLKRVQHDGTRAFTLAEVLVTLAIIGVVASLTIPTLVKDTQNQKTRKAFPAIYSIISQATMSIMADNDGTFKNSYAQGVTGYISSDLLRNKYAEYLKSSKSCDEGAAIGNCWHPSYPDANYALAYNRTPMQYEQNTAALILLNGAVLKFGGTSPSCTLSTVGTMTTLCAWVHVDVNGFKGPNIYGEDIYQIFIFENGIKPAGFQGSGTENTCQNDENGFGTSCAAKNLAHEDY